MRELNRQFAGALLVILTVASVFAALINFQQQKKFHLPDDGVVWRETANGVVAAYIAPGGPAERAGVHTYDILRSIEKASVHQAIDVPSILVGIKTWSQVEYTLVRGGIEFRTQVIVSESPVSSARKYLLIVGISFLFMGLLVYFRRSVAPKSQQFYVLCLTSFIFFCFHDTGKLNNFDKTVYWAHLVASILSPTLMVHFSLTFPHARSWLRSPWMQSLLYLPGALLLAAYVGCANGWIVVDLSVGDVQWLLDRAHMWFFCGMLLLTALAASFAYRWMADPVIRQQLRWLRNGAVFGILPFAILYGVPYALGNIPSETAQMATLSLPLIPLTWAYAIIRYRLFEVDIIFEQGYIYTLATIFVLGAFYGLFFLFMGKDDLKPTTVVSLILIATFLFLPIRNWIQEELDRNFFYKGRYETRQSLISFARELSAETDLDRMLEVLGERLRHTLSIRHLAFFLTDERDGKFYLKMRAGQVDDETHPIEHLDLSFLSTEIDKQYLFFEHTRNLVDIVSRRWSGSVRRTISDLDLTYYLPCQVRGKTIGYIGLSRPTQNDFLSRDDMELLLTLTGYVGIAIENSRLYHSLQRKAEEFERLKEFSENIVESINVGILAADLEDHIESWNSQMQRLTGIPREVAVGRSLQELFPAELCAKFDEVRGQIGVHNIYKFVLKPELEAPPVAEKMLVAVNGNGNGHSNGHYATESHRAGTVSPASTSRERIINVAIAPLISNENEQIGRLIIIDDVTSQAELERQLVQADKLSSIGLLAAGVAHEVNTPLAVISTYAQMLAKQVTTDDPKSMLLEKIAKQTFRASEIVNSLLNFSRTAPTEFTRVDLNKTVRETAALLQHQLEKAGVQVDLQLDSALPAIRGNGGKLQQVFLNLILNARDAMERGGKLMVRTSAEGDHSIVEVIDNGSGISSENLARVFDPFFTTKGAKKGTGLGLAVTYGIVQEHNGTITVDSQPGSGTRFRLEFPLADKPVHV